MICYRCKNNFWKEKFCPHCINYSMFNNKIVQKYVQRNNLKSKLLIKYNLTKAQQEISKKILLTKEDILVYAVCGAGKTEIILSDIYNFLKQNKRVGFFIPRIEIVKEVSEKLKSFFPKNSVSSIYGNKKPILSDIVVATCHKATKYINQIDLVILDEVDAFPLSDLKTLQKICFNLAREKTIFLSATPPTYLPKNIKIFKLNERFHKQPIPLPMVKKTKFIKLELFKFLLKNKKPLFVFFPTIKIQEKYFNYFKNKFNIKKINSKTKSNNKILNQFKNEKSPIIFTTSVLERGVTFPNLNVVVINADHDLYNKNEIIQISGRVGRSKNYPKGDVVLFCFNKNKIILEAIKEIKLLNEMHNMQ